MGAHLLAAGTSFSTPANIAFGMLAVLMIFGAVRVVTTHNVVHAALWLVVVLAGVAANYLLLQAEFVAVTQVMVYIGAIVVLFLFGVMLTRAKLGVADDLDSPSQQPVAVIVAGLLLAVLGYSLIHSFKDVKMEFGGARTTGSGSAEAIADSIFSTYLLPFELISVLLLAALIGAIVLARKE